MDVPVKQHSEFFALALERYEELARTGDTSPAAIIKALSDAMVGHRVLTQVVLTKLCACAAGFANFYMAISTGLSIISYYIDEPVSVHLTLDNRRGFMLKKLLMFSVAVLFVGTQVGLAMAANPDTGPGCGLGKLAWSDYKGQKEIAPQVMMATTNGTFGSNTFGISSGTSGCTNDGKVMGDSKTIMFAELNFDNLSQEMAQGQGNTWPHWRL